MTRKKCNTSSIAVTFSLRSRSCKSWPTRRTKTTRRPRHDWRAKAHDVLAAYYPRLRDRGDPQRARGGGQLKGNQGDHEPRIGLEERRSRSRLSRQPYRTHADRRAWPICDLAVPRQRIPRLEPEILHHNRRAVGASH